MVKAIRNKHMETDRETERKNKNESIEEGEKRIEPVQQVKETISFTQCHSTNQTPQYPLLAPWEGFLMEFLLKKNDIKTWQTALEGAV